MRVMYRKLRSRFTRDQAGQSIVLLAIAFIALGAFVGLVTDISVLFVRYSTLSRTIDSAAIAAAGQIREGTDYGTVALTAKQFIQMHGLEPSRVTVETCETDIYAWRTGTGVFEGQPPHPEPEPLDNMPNTELCNWQNPRKLVRVRAQIDSETFFLRLVGIDTITLEATALSETAVIDVALVLDTSQSMSEETTVTMYDTLLPNASYNWSNNPNCYSTTADDYDTGSTGPGPEQTAFRYGPCCNDPGNGITELQPDGTWRIVPPPSGTFTAGPDGLYDDLICQPFKDVKDAARNFIRRLDYVRGDRVALITFDSSATPILPNGVTPGSGLYMMADEQLAIDTLNNNVGVNPQTTPPYPTGKTNSVTFWGDCRAFFASIKDYYNDQSPYISGTYDNPENQLPDGSYRRVFSYESTAPCPDTNIGGGVRAATSTITSPVTIRNDAVWVIILLTDGSANRTDPIDLAVEPEYGYYGFCPWNTFCTSSYRGVLPVPPYDECDYSTTSGYELPYCNDNDNNTRHDCLIWTNDPATSGQLDTTDPDCVPIAPSYKNERYDADDYARDWADFAGLITLYEDTTGSGNDVPGNFIAMFTIAFGNRALDLTGEGKTSAPLLRYIADVGDNGFLDDDKEQDLRDDGIINGSVTNWGEPGPCAGLETQPGEDCGQYYYANDLDDLERVFESIASRLFTRLSRQLECKGDRLV